MAEIDLTWSPSIDNIAVAGYRIRRDSAVIGTVDGATTHFNDTGLLASTQYHYTVEAFDASGNYSGESAVATATSGTTPPPTGTFIWNGDFSPGNLSQWGGVEYVGTGKTSPPISSRIVVTASIDGVNPPSGMSHFARIQTFPGDQYFSTTGWRTLIRQYEPLQFFNQGYDSWFVFAALWPSGFPGDANMWVSPWEMHQTKASYVTVTGVAPAHFIAVSNHASIDVAGGRDGARIVGVNQSILSGYLHGVWQIFAFRYFHHPTTGAFELWHGQEGAGSMTQLISKSNIGTMYEGTTNYLEWGQYRAMSGSGVITTYLAGVREYAHKTDALAFATSLL